ncbi:MAG: ATPase, T2SS/T4P/T4SS family [Clostridia bacterium]|jgi:pilus assembly protein CpaF|nr:ATPase, T2SS/T4P/T4SS family [Clostridia bacterium]
MKFLESELKELKVRAIEKIGSEKDEIRVKEAIVDIILEKFKFKGLTIEEIDKLKNNMYNSIKEYGKIQKYLDDDSITEIMINGTRNIYIERDCKLIKLEDRFDSEEELYQMIQKIVGRINRKLNLVNPIVDARLLDGSRVNVINKNIAIGGPIITIRKFKKEFIEIDKLVENKMFDSEIKKYLKKAIVTKKNIVICGGTGTGKTTLLNALARFIDSNERIISIEDSAEIDLSNIENLVSLEVKDKDIETGIGVSMSDLIKASLRMRPDRIIIGEVRGKEAFDLLKAMNTGHKGTLSTGHSNSAIDMIRRLHNMVLEGYKMSEKSIENQIYSAIDIIIFIEKDKSLRKIKEVVELINGNNEIKKIL